MISIHPTTFDIQGGIVGEPLPGSDLRSTERRLSRSALLDGTSTIYDGGYSDGDRTMTVLLRADRTTADRAAELQRLYSTLIVSTSDGCYRAGLLSVRYDAAVLSLTILIRERIDS